MTSGQKIIFRADGNSIIGLGHFFRVLALAELLKEDFNCVMVISLPDDFVRSQIKASGLGLIELKEVIYKKPGDKHDSEEIAFDMEHLLEGNEIVVLDGYWFGNTYQSKVHAMGCTVVFIDDMYEEYPYADIIINHSLSAAGGAYKNTSAKILAGPDYCLIRREFLAEAKKKDKKNKFDTAFVCFGGADTEELAYKAAYHLAAISFINTIHIMNSSSYKGTVGKFEQMGLQSGKSIKVHQNLNPAEIIHLMRNSDLAIVSASNTAYECICMKLPIIIGHYVDHQIRFYEALALRKNVVGAGKWQEVTDEIFRSSIEKLIASYDPEAKNFIDGFQQKRFLDIFRSLAHTHLNHLS